MSKRERTIGLAVGLVIGIAVVDRVVEGLWATRSDLQNQIVEAQKELHTDRVLLAKRNENKAKLDRLMSTSLQRDASESNLQLLERLYECLNQVNVSTTATPYRMGAPAPAARAGKASKDGVQFMKQVAHVTLPGNMQKTALFTYLLNGSNIPVRVTEMQFNPTKADGWTDEFKVEFNIATIFLTQSQQETRLAQSAAALPTTTKPASNTSTQQPGRQGQPARGQQVGGQRGPNPQASEANSTTRPVVAGAQPQGVTGGTPSTNRSEANR
jgi:uncharacterized membrane-anchored protein YhcB (DUF1043 family)